MRPSATARAITPVVVCGCQSAIHSTSRADVSPSSHALTSKTTHSTAAKTAALPIMPQCRLRNSSSSQ